MMTLKWHDCTTTPKPPRPCAKATIVSPHRQFAIIIIHHHHQLIVRQPRWSPILDQFGYVGSCHISCTHPNRQRPPSRRIRSCRTLGNIPTASPHRQFAIIVIHHHHQVGSSLSSRGFPVQEVGLQICRRRWRSASPFACSQPVAGGGGAAHTPP